MMTCSKPEQVNPRQAGWVRLELTVEVVARLLEQKQLCVADFRCLDCESKSCVWRMCLMNCAKNIKTEADTGCPCQGCGACERAESLAVQEVRIRMAADQPVNCITLQDDLKSGK